MPRPSLSHTAKMPFPTGKGITKQAQVGIPLHYTSQVFRQPCNFATPVAGRRMYQQAGLLAQASSPLLRLPVCNHSDILGARLGHYSGGPAWEFHPASLFSPRSPLAHRLIYVEISLHHAPTPVNKKGVLLFNHRLIFRPDFQRSLHCVPFPFPVILKTETQIVCYF